jgi:hypothetical protein
MNLTVIWNFLVGACELIHIFLCKGRICNKYAKNIRCHHTKFIHLGDQEVPGICAYLDYRNKLLKIPNLDSLKILERPACNKIMNMTDL